MLQVTIIESIYDMLKAFTTTLFVSSLLVTSSADARLRGGGPVSGAIAYWVTKSLCYGAVGTAVAVGTGTAIAAAGVASPAVAGGLAIAGIAGTPAALAAEGAVVATAVFSTAPAAGAIATSATVAGLSTGSVAGGVAAIETASTAAMYIFTVCPWLP